MPPKATCPNQHIISILQKRVDELRKEKPDSFQIPGLLKAIKNVRAHPQWLANGAEAQKAITGIGPAVAKMIDEGIAQLPAPPRPVVTEALGVSLVTSREVRPFFDTEDEQNDFYDLLADTVTPRRSRGGIDMPSLTSRTPADTPRADFQTPSQFGIGVLPPQTPLVGVHTSRSQQTTSTQPQQRQQQPILTPQPPTTETPSSSAAAGAAPSASSASLSGNPSVPKRMRTIDVAPTFGTPNYAILVSLLAAKHATPPVTLISAEELIPRTEPKLTPVLFESTMSDLLERGMVDVTSRKKQYCLTDEGHKLATDAYNLARRLRKEQRIISGVSAISTPMPSPTVGPLGNSLAGSSRAAGGASVTNRSVSSNSTASSRTSASHSLGPSPELLELRDDLDDALLYPGRVVVTSNTQRSRTTHRASSSAVLSGPVDETSVIILDSDDDPPTNPRAFDLLQRAG
ncbi:hypothetical protein BCR44DRAFT_1247308 [Catenaria anguillulae PL171]|uniref:Crossover junction endonuclease MUS81 n=1 Tax=Catenaria anguillulae PL171 TaxID=765915 RepID=A0A1Y2HXR0_9FUNG|nr:hypothetical protein BCR44DRAFT_1247308 [Catenaria anguillulae PL171]